VFHYCDTAFFNYLLAPAVFGTATLQSNLLENRGEEQGKTEQFCLLKIVRNIVTAMLR
jgi:hypothetical protein